MVSIYIKGESRGFWNLSLQPDPNTYQLALDYLHNFS